MPSVKRRPCRAKAATSVAILLLVLLLPSAAAQSKGSSKAKAASSAKASDKADDGTGKGDAPAGDDAAANHTSAIELVVEGIRPTERFDVPTLVSHGELDPERPPHIFGVSGYSGAGTAPSDKNDPDKLRDNIMPYALAGHIHEREVGRQLGQDVRFMPHVGAHFRGISLTVSADLQSATTPEAVHALFAEYYAGEPLVEVAAVGEYPHVQDVAHKHHVGVGGFTVDASGRRVVICSAIDNLLKGAAGQAIQAANLMMSLPEDTGLPTTGWLP